MKPRAEWLLLAAAVILLAGWMIWRVVPVESKGLQAEIRLNGTLWKTVSLASDQSLQLPDKKVTLQVSASRIRFEESDCRDLVCVRAGWLSRAGMSAACLPNGVTVTVKGGGGQLDAVSQ